MITLFLLTILMVNVYAKPNTHNINVYNDDKIVVPLITIATSCAVFASCIMFLVVLVCYYVYCSRKSKVRYNIELG